ncbi:outer membrane beta-barrel protein [uncultured Winogradskyella sp.]|uniref:outer membrane beta-barrel protein n=1 Tax=uncultured Winogradskyella sp. TaxID=395353 RepID=UPI00261DBEDB|nr:outer membrane beta-barrel protein [uncultured Winogradskyella sp.]
MKKIVLLICLLISTFFIYSQEFGVKGGLNFTFFKITEGDFGTNPNTEVGYYGGAFVDFKIDNGFHFQPELLYKGIGDFRFLNAPLYLKYDIYNTVHILVGPSLNYFFDFFTNNFKVRADLSLDYDLSKDLSMHMKYTIGFEELSPNVLFLGLGYRL